MEEAHGLDEGDPLPEDAGSGGAKAGRAHAEWKNASVSLSPPQAAGGRRAERSVEQGSWAPDSYLPKQESHVLRFWFGFGGSDFE